MDAYARRVAQEVRAMTRKEVITKAIEGRITWLQAADILGITARHMRRLRARFEKWGWGGLRDRRAGKPRRKRIPLATIQKLCRLRRERYMDFSVKHFHEIVTEKHGIALSYTWTKQVLYAAGLAEKAPARGKYHRKRERRPMRGMLVHMDASTHEWIAGLPMWDLVVAMDDADGRILFGRFVEQEGSVSSLEALHHIVTRYGRFCELYTDRGSHFVTTSHKDDGPNEVQTGHVVRAVRALGIRQILARSPQARGRSERAFGTIQRRLPPELRVAGVRSYRDANRYLEELFIPDFNRRFTVEPAQKESAFMPVVGIDLVMLMSVQHERIVRGDNTVLFDKAVLQLEPTAHRPHFARCPVLVHELLDGTLAISHQGRLLGRYNRDGQPLSARRTSLSANG